jgi:H+/Cl- antiporter ClcA
MSFNQNTAEKINITFYLKWILILILIAFFAGGSSFIFLYLLDFFTLYRTSHSFLILFLPIAGFLVGLIYLTFGNNLKNGNNIIIDEIINEDAPIDLKLAPFVLISTLLSHLVGASVGREGTALQMSASLSDQISRIFILKKNERKTLLIAAVAGGFAAVFGTPLAAAVFAVEFYRSGKLDLKNLIPAFIVAFLAHYFCVFLGANHTVYSIGKMPNNNFSVIIFTMVSGFIFGLVAYFYKKLSHYFSKIIEKINFYEPFKPLFGGIIILALYVVFDLNKYMGLGINTISAAFINQQGFEVSFIKIILTVFTLSVGFKGGEVTPLFFIGATLGSALIAFIPLPIGFMAALGFAAVFAGATNTPYACTLLGFELFGIDTSYYFLMVCMVSNYFSGNCGIYSSQIKNVGYFKLNFLK